MQWLVSKRFDLVFIIGSVAASFFFLGFYEILVHIVHMEAFKANVLVSAIFFFGLDQPHIFQTASRVIADEGERKRLKKMMIFGTIGFVAVAEGMTYVGWDDYFTLAFAIFGVYHITRQNVGFLKAYRKVNDDNDPVSNKIDLWAYYFVMFGCMVGAGTQETYFNNKPSLPSWAATLSLTLSAVVVGFYAIYQIKKARDGKHLNAPKLLLMGATSFTHLFIFYFLRIPGLFTVMDTAYHDVQYHAWIGHYQRRRFPSVKYVTLRWLAASSVFGTASFFFMYERGAYIENGIYALICVHYIVDGDTWKFSRDRSLAKLLLGERKPAAPASLEAA